MPALTVAQLAELCAGEVEGDSRRVITGANALEDARETDLSFVANAKAAAAASSSIAGCLMVVESFDQSGPWALIRVPEPRAAFARALAALYPQTRPAPEVHPTAIIAPSATLGDDCFIGAYVMIGEETRIGDGCWIGEHSSIGNRVVIGADATLHPNVTVYDGTQIGARVILHSGCVIGADGFGFTLCGDHYEKFPQVGVVAIGDDVEIGANCCIDRAALGVTRIADGAKLDNLVHVAHNCSIGKHVVIAAQSGFSGSVTVGDYAVIGGQTGVADRAKVASKAIVGAKSGIVTGQRVGAGEPVWGIPARPLRQHLKGLANVARLAELRSEIRELKKKVAELEAALRKAEE
jgi:UDP-3-O-[3-hydroxymyristoyl] glucosamine N-acyltransferase